MLPSLISVAQCVFYRANKDQNSVKKLFFTRVDLDFCLQKRSPMATVDVLPNVMEEISTGSVLLCVDMSK